MTKKKPEYFFLNNNCILVSGRKASAIYDLNNQTICSIDNKISSLIKSCKAGNKIIEFNSGNSEENTEIMKYLMLLQQNKYGFFSKKYIVTEELEPNWGLNRPENKNDPIDIKKAWIEIIRNCNLKCIHCFEYDGSISKCSCTRDPVNKRGHFDAQKGKQIIRDLDVFNCKEIVLIGGEPTLEKKLLKEMINDILNTKIKKIRVKTNLTTDIDNLLLTLKNERIIVDTTIFSNTKKTNEEITNKRDTFYTWIKNAEKIIANNISLEVNIEVLKKNEDQINQTITFLKELGVKKIIRKFIYSNNPEIWPDKYSSHMIFDESKISGVKKDEFFYNRERNPCWYGKLAVTFDGFILPCIMARNHIIAHIDHKSVKEVMIEKLPLAFWTITKDKITFCKDCEFRYSCSDCRPIQCQDGSLYKGNRFCEI